MRKTQAIKNIVAYSLITLTALSGAQAMELAGEESATSPLYTTTKSAVKKTLTKMGVDFTEDDDGDFRYKIADTSYRGFVIFNETSSSKKIWNLQVVAQFATKKSRYDDLLKFANKWNSEKKVPKLSMVDDDSLRVSINYPVQYGFNPDEFEENVLLMFNRTISKIAKQTYDWRL